MVVGWGRDFEVLISCEALILMMLFVSYLEGPISGGG